MTAADASPAESRGGEGRLFGARPARLLLAAAALHVVVACLTFAAGRAGLPPLDADGVFAHDAAAYHEQARELARRLTREGPASWLGAADAPPHVRLYSLSYAALGPVLGRSVLCAEPLNLLFYLTTLWLVYRIGAEAFGRRAGLISAAAVAVWPSFLLHTTQPLKDPLSVACVLALVLVCLTWLKRALTPARGLALGAAAAAPLFLLAGAKSNMWESLVLLVALGAGLMAVRFARERRVAFGNVLCAALVTAILFGAPQRQTSVRVKDRLASEASAAAGGGVFWTLAGARIAARRAQFVKVYRGSGSSVDEEIVFRDTPDILRHLPRAAAVGLFAPFPSMWFARGESVGLGGRFLAGAETLLFYLAAALACAGAWRARREPAAWLLLSFALANVVALGLVVTNVGAIYRLRFPFAMLVLILCASNERLFGSPRPPPAK